MIMIGRVIIGVMVGLGMAGLADAVIRRITFSKDQV
jgi:hypothetical protein